ncbi:MAG TPA: hypothetical protein RMH99_12770 [Sandaracinaceae bacterium LLY-WYZ-13_1]|nr:hypothetical protein [Sandaracinaceae bacterium LLY-WYZ-13_1]
MQGWKNGSDSSRGGPTSRAAVWALSVLASSGCSLLIDNDQFVGGRTDAGEGDAASIEVDAGLPDAGPNAPTTPEIHIEPESPRTLDDLLVVVDTGSTDPLDRGPVTYEYSWIRVDPRAEESGERLSHELTAKGEIWRVETTPVTSDGRRGIPAAVETTIENTPPTLVTVGLSHYRPVSGDTLPSLDPLVEDVDGDTPTVRYRWFADGLEISGATSSRLTLAEEDAPVGSEIMVEARAFDGELESAPVTAGPALVVADVDRWVQHLPDRGAVEITAYDPRHERMLLVTTWRGDSAPQLWEHDLGSDRFVRLHPSGTIPEEFSFSPTPLWDRVGERFFFLSADDDFVRLFELTVGDRGRESFREVPLTGDPIPTVSMSLGAVGVFDPNRDRILVPAPNPSAGSDIWAIDVSGSEGATQLVLDSQPFEILNGTWIGAPDRDQAYVLGGGQDLGGAVSDLVYVIDLANVDAGLRELTERLPVAGSRFMAALSADGDEVLFGYGLGAGGGPVDGFWQLDLVAESISTVAIDDSRFSGAIGGWLATRPRSGDTVVWSGRELEDLFGHNEYELYRLPVSLDTVEPIHVFGVDAPRPLASAIAGRVRPTGIGIDALVFFGGEDLKGVPHGNAWRLDVLMGAPFERMAPYEIMEGATDGAPGVRSAVHPASGDLFAFFGGRDGETSLADGVTWRLDGSRWVVRDLASGESPPTPRREASFFELGSCGGDLGVVGGLDASGASLDLVQVMSCDSSDADCRWTTISAGGGPGPRWRAAVLERAIVVGGGEASGPIDAYRLDNCGASPFWEELTPIGDVPENRRGHVIESSYMFGGRTASGFSNEAHVVTRLGTDLRFERVEPPSDGDGLPRGRSRAVVLVDNDGPRHDRLFVYGGESDPPSAVYSDARVLGDLWELRMPR